ncbi:hypothetical protein P3S68_021678 [Capsicum galapagoense]
MVKMDTLRDSLNAVKIERDELKQKLEHLEAVNYPEVNKTRNLGEKLLKMKMLLIVSFVVFVGFMIAISK